MFQIKGFVENPAIRIWRNGVVFWFTLCQWNWEIDYKNGSIQIGPFALYF